MSPKAGPQWRGSVSRVTWLEAAGPLASPEGAAGWAQEGNSLDLTEPNNAPPHRARARPGRRWSLLPPGRPRTARPCRLRAGPPANPFSSKTCWQTLLQASYRTFVLLRPGSKTLSSLIPFCGFCCHFSGCHILGSLTEGGCEVTLETFPVQPLSGQRVGPHVCVPLLELPNKKRVPFTAT